MKKLIISISTVVVVLALDAASSTPLARAQRGIAVRAAPTTITVKGGEFFFHLSRKTLSAPGAVTFRFTNVGHVAHDFKIDGKKTPLVSPGKSASLAVKFTKGKFPYLCTVPGHAALGMKGTFTVG